METRSLIDLLQIQYPLLLAPMAGISGGRLAVAVSRAGGFGFVGGGYGDRKWLGDQLSLCANQNFGVGFISWALERQPELLQLALESAPRAILLSFGSINDFASRIRDAGVVLVAQVQTVQQARDAVRQGAQIIVAQGGEAGGHSGTRGTLALVPAVVDATTPVPVVAAGGIADGRGFAAARMLGAAGILCGTAFYVADESLAHARAKQRLIESSGDDTFKGSVFDSIRGLAWPAGPWQLRAVHNHFSRRWENDPHGLRANFAAEQHLYSDAHARGDFNVDALIAGEAVDLVRSTASAKTILETIITDARQRLKTQLGDCCARRRIL